MGNVPLERSLLELYEAVDVADLRQRLSRHLVDRGFWGVSEGINSLKVNEVYLDPGKYVWDNLTDYIGDRRSDILNAFIAACLSEGVEEESRRLRWLKAQTRPYLVFSSEAAKFKANHEVYKVLEDFGLHSANTLIVPLPDGGAGRHRLWAYADTASALRNAQQAVALMMTYNHMSGLVSTAAAHGGGGLTAIGDPAPAECVPDPMHDPGPTSRTIGLELVRGAAGRDQAVRLYIEHHLHDADLGVDRLCRRFAMSRRTIYRMFAAEGGVTRYLTGRRLIRAFGELRASSPSRGLINAVAISCGFDDLPRFCRLFRERFAITPSDAVGLGPANDEPALSRSNSANDAALGSPALVRSAQPD